MSASSDCQAGRLAQDESFLECHKLLNSMEDSSSTVDKPPSSTPNGHCGDDTHQDGVDEDESLSPKSDNYDGSKHSAEDLKKSNNGIERASGKSNGVNGLDENSDEKCVPVVSEKSDANGSGSKPIGIIDDGEKNVEDDSKPVDNNEKDEKTIPQSDTMVLDDEMPTLDKPNSSSADGVKNGMPTLKKAEPMPSLDDAKPADKGAEKSPIEANLPKKGFDLKDSDLKIAPGSVKTPSLPDPTKNDNASVPGSAEKTSLATPDPKVIDPSSSIPTSTNIARSGSQQGQAASLSGTPSTLSASQKLIAPKPNDVPVITTQVFPNSLAPQNKVAKSETKGRKKKNANATTQKIPRDLGPTASFLCDLGLDLVKEGVYRDLISIQSRKNRANKLSASEQKQLEKLKDNFDTVANKNKDVRVSFNMKCDKCKFVTESKNVMWMHHESPHTDDRDNLFCSHCDFATRNPVSFNYHMEAEHHMKGRIIPKASFWTCATCPFETNSKGTLTKHKWKCEKGFDYKTNLCPTSSHVNYCLAYNFYKKPKIEPPPPPKEVPPLRAPARPSRAAVRPSTPVGPVLKQPMMAPRPMFTQNRAMLTPARHRNQVPMQMIVQQNKQPMLLQNSMQQPYQFVTRTSSPNVTVRQMLNNAISSAPNFQPRSVIRAPPRPQTDLGLVSCEICKGFVKDKDALRVHFYFAHQIDLPATLLKRAQPPLFCDVCMERFWTSQGLQKHKETFKHYSKPQPNPQQRLHICIICGIHVTHLLSHMSTIHNLSLKDFLIAKRCIVCGGSFQNRPSLEIHLASTHGILVKTSPATGAATATPPPPRPSIISRPAQAPPAARVMPLALLREAGASTCIICNISFLNVDLLTKHCEHCHTFCAPCGMIFADVPTRNRHKCSFEYSNTLIPCRVCGCTVLSRNMKGHVERVHLKRKLKVNLKRERHVEEMGKEYVKRRRMEAEKSVITIDDDDSPNASGSVEKKSEPVKTAPASKTAEETMSDKSSGEKKGETLVNSESKTAAKSPSTEADGVVVEKENSSDAKTGASDSIDNVGDSSKIETKDDRQSNTETGKGDEHSENGSKESAIEDIKADTKTESSVEISDNNPETETQSKSENIPKSKSPEPIADKPETDKSTEEPMETDQS